MADQQEAGNDLGKKLVDDIRQTGKVSQFVKPHMDSSVAIFGDLYKKNEARIEALSPKEQYEEIKKLAAKSAELSPVVPYSGATGLIKADIDVLIQDSAKMDAPGKEGEHLKAWAKDVATAVKDVDFTKIYNETGKNVDAAITQVYIAKLGKAKMDDIANNIRESAVKNISPEFKTQSLEQNLVSNIRKSGTDDDDDKPKRAFNNVKGDEPQAPGGDMLKLILMFIGMLLGIDMGSLFPNSKASQQAQDDTQKAAADKDVVALKPALEDKIKDLLPASEHLSSGKYAAADLNAVAKFSGNKPEDMAHYTADQAKQLGDFTSKEITDMRSGAKTEDQAKKEIGDSINAVAGKSKQASAAGEKLTEGLANTVVPGSGTVLNLVHSFKHLEEFAKNNMPPVDPNAPMKPLVAVINPSVPKETPIKAPTKTT